MPDPDDWITCDECNGVGKFPSDDPLDSFPIICETCNGFGGWYHDEDDDDGQPDGTQKCHDYDSEC